MGQVTHHGNRILTWNPWGQLIKIQDPDLTWQAIYDPLGRRIQTRSTPKGGPTQTTNTYFDPETEFQEIGAQINNKTYWKLHGPTTCDGVEDNHGNTLSLQYNALSQLQQLNVNLNTNIVSANCTAYGPQTLPAPPTDLLTYAATLVWHSTSPDPTGLVLFGKRYYNPKTGKFLSPDPISFPVCTNLYTYSFNDPINYYDPSGRFASTLYTKATGFVKATFDSPIVQSGLQIAGGITEAYAGLTLSSVSGPLGIAVACHGFDQITTGLRTLYHGRTQPTVTSLTLQSTGLSASTANTIDTALCITAIANPRVGTSIIRTSLPRSSRNILKSPQPKTRENLKFSRQYESNPLHGTTLKPKLQDQLRLHARTCETDFHAFPRIVDNYAHKGKTVQIIGKDGILRRKVILPGGYKGRDGHFEWIIENNNSINHRLFVPHE